MATKEDHEITAQLNDLKKEIDRNEELMRQAAIAYEDLVAEKQSLQSSLEDLQKTRAEIREQTAQPSPQPSEMAT